MLMKLFRCGQKFHNSKLKFLSAIIYRIQFYLYNTSLPHSVKLGENTQFAYGGIACVIHERAELGDGCVIGQCITIGGRSKHRDVPILGDNVYIGAGARVLGPIKIGNNVIIAPNSVVLDDIPANTIVGGIPAKIIRGNIDPKNYI